jgi:Domain of unknown function (DUF6285)
MSYQMKGLTLLACARKEFKEQIFPHLSATQRHSALMIINALSIVERQMDAGSQALLLETNAIKALLNKDDELHKLKEELCADIREGRFDPGSSVRTQVFDFIRMVVRLRLLESNPKVLQNVK